MNTKNIITIGALAVVGIIIYNVVKTKEKKEDSNFSAACGCGG
jgi:hypothetical protein